MFDAVNKIFVGMEDKMNLHIPDRYAKLLRLSFGALLLGHWIGCLNFMLVRQYGFPSDISPSAECCFELVRVVVVYSLN